MRYFACEDTQIEFIEGRPTLSTAENGKVVVDKTMLSLWKLANGKTLAEVESLFQPKLASPKTIAAALACLTEARLLTQDGSEKRFIHEYQDPGIIISQSLISAVIVVFKGLAWLPDCLSSLKSQTLQCCEIIIVNNGSDAATTDWLNANHPDVQIIETGQAIPFAAALNQGINTAKGDYFLALNQDIVLKQSAVHCLFNSASLFDSAAIAACLRFMWAPAFLNGIGNQVRAIGWGSDNFIGTLDLGQFKHLDEVPSICLAAALINRRAWEQVGPFDDGFPMYYEDSEWSYRARLMGFQIRAAPDAVVYHAFGGFQNGSPGEISLSKLENVVYSRLRFNSKLLTGWRKAWRLLLCFFQDFCGVVAAIIKARPEILKAIWHGWSKWLNQTPSRINFSPLDPDVVFCIAKQTLVPRIWKGMPELTWESIYSYYLPLILSGQTRPIPEFQGLVDGENKVSRPSWLLRMYFLWQGEGILAVLRWYWRSFRWALG